MRTYHYLYGPVPSRRLGGSLGVDLVPRKLCTYDCIYCQVGQTTKKTLERREYVPEGEVLAELRDFLTAGRVPIDYLSLSGSGEPTLHSKIGSIIRGIKAFTSVPVAVLTNGSLLHLKEVREELTEADVILPSLDAVSKEVFARINRPHRGLSVQKVVEGLVEFRKVYRGQIWLEILFCKGINDGESELVQMRERIGLIRPDLIHLNTVIRPPAEAWATPLLPEEMEKIRTFFGDKAFVISEFDRHPLTLSHRDIKEEIFKVLRRRPLSLTDLSKRMSIPKKELAAYIEPLVEEGKVKTHQFGDSVYYEASSG